MIDEIVLTKEIMATIIFGVKNCGPGLVIVNGKAIKIPPRGPSYDKISAALKTIKKEMNITE